MVSIRVEKLGKIKRPISIVNIVRWLLAMVFLSSRLELSGVWSIGLRDIEVVVAVISFFRLEQSGNSLMMRGEVGKASLDSVADFDFVG